MWRASPRDGTARRPTRRDAVWIVADHRDESPKATASSTDKVFIEADDLRPWIDPMAALEFELRGKRLAEVPARAAMGASHQGEVAETLARPQQPSRVALCAPIALSRCRAVVRERAPGEGAPAYDE